MSCKSWVSMSSPLQKRKDVQPSQSKKGDVNQASWYFFCFCMYNQVFSFVFQYFKPGFHGSYVLDPYDLSSFQILREKNQ